ncbi:MAG: tetratricopeptide repeat protein [Limnothrix sp. RL_2_0]|nr:tetratricopeptide repeat protein [Limnothrix sp. RL_2_0]
MEVTKEKFGESHLGVAGSMNNLASLYESQGKYAAAEPLYKEALSLFESLLGADHPSTATVRENYKIFLQQKASAATPPKEGLLSKVWNILKTEL